MFRRIALAGATAAVIVGAGTGALALTGAQDTAGSPTPSPSPSSSSSSGSSGSSSSGSPASGHGTPKQRRAALRKGLRRVAHAQFVTRGMGGFVEHDVIVGEVTSVSATAISVKAADGYTETFTVATTTKVRQRPASGKGKGTASTIGAVHDGDRVAAFGMKAKSSDAHPTARAVVDGLRQR